MRKIKNWLKRSTQIFNGLVYIGKLIVASTSALQDNEIFRIGNTDESYISLTIDPSEKFSELNVVLKDYYNGYSGDITLKANVEEGILLYHGTDCYLKFGADDGILLRSDTGGLHFPNLVEGDPGDEDQIYGASTAVRISEG